MPRRRFAAAQWLAMAALLAACTWLPFPTQAACPFENTLRRKALQVTEEDVTSFPFAPGAIPDDVAGGNFLLPYGGITAHCSMRPPLCDGSPSAPTWVDIFKIAKDQVSPEDDVCYWSWGSFPPPGATEAPYNFSGREDEMREVVELGYDGWMRLARQAAPSACTYGCGMVVWSSSTPGSEIVRYLCAKNETGSGGIYEDVFDCTDAHLNQLLRWPTQTHILRLNNTNSDAVLALMKEWRRSEEGHQPAMNSDVFYRDGWGWGGARANKLFKCADIPAAFRTTQFPPPLQTEVTEGGMTLADESVQFWSTTKGLWFNVEPWAQAAAAQSTASPVPPNLAAPPPPSAGAAPWRCPAPLALLLLAALASLAATAV